MKIFKLRDLFFDAIAYLFGGTKVAPSPGQLRFVGYLAGRGERRRGHGRVLTTTLDRSEALNHQRNPRKAPVYTPVYRKVWTDNGRKSKRFAATN